MPPPMHVDRSSSQTVVAESMPLMQQSDQEQPRARSPRGKLQAAAAATAGALGLLAAARFVSSREPVALERSRLAPGRNTLQAWSDEEWSCQRYSHDQDDEWCEAAGIQSGIEYKFVGPDGPEAGLCSECWCCKRTVEETQTPVVHHHAQHSNGSSKPEAAAPWRCHNYAEGQDNSWCQAAGKQSGLEYKWVGSAEDTCGECWCCKRDIEEVEVSDKGSQVNATANKKEVSDKGSQVKATADKKEVKTDEQAASAEEEGMAPWQCHRYEVGQDNEWCKAAGNISGYEYRFVGSAENLCAECWCCKQPLKKCSKNGQDCRKTECCEQEGFQCYEQAANWATCKSTCTEDDWSCKELGERTPAPISDEGAGPGEICAVVEKCTQPGYQCFQMNDFYSACKVTCETKGWTCKEYGERTPLQTTAGTECAWGGDLCMPFGCCVAEGLQCYERDEYWSSCMLGCKHSMNMEGGPEKWSCKEYGQRTKVELGCTWGNEECGSTKLCCHPGFSCVKKDEDRAYCTLETDLPGWDGTIIGGSHNEWPVQPVEAGSEDECGTSLFCFMAVLPNSAEQDLRWAAESKQASIFACDEYEVYDSWQSARADSGESTDGKVWDSVINTDVFVNVWEQVLNQGLYKNHDWTVKVDPDAVFFADRLKYKLGNLHAPKGWPIYIKNTEKEFGFLGACEVLSLEAVKKYSRYYKECFAVISAGSGEDGFIKGCMDMIGAGYMVELDVLRTPWHPGACTDPGRVTFHPRKDAGSWDQCYQEALR